MVSFICIRLLISEIKNTKICIFNFFLICLALKKEINKEAHLVTCIRLPVHGTSSRRK